MPSCPKAAPQILLRSRISTRSQASCFRLARARTQRRRGVATPPFRFVVWLGQLNTQSRADSGCGLSRCPPSALCDQVPRVHSARATSAGPQCREAYLMSRPRPRSPNRKSYSRAPGGRRRALDCGQAQRRSPWHGPLRRSSGGLPMVWFDTGTGLLVGMFQAQVPALLRSVSGACATGP